MTSAAERQRPGRCQEPRLRGCVRQLVHLDVRPPAAGADPEVAGHLAARDRNVAVLEVPAHHDQLGRADQLVPAADPRPSLHRAGETPSSMVAGTPSQREYMAGSVNAARVTAWLVPMSVPA